MIELSGITWDHPRGYEPLLASQAPYAASFGVNVSWQKRSLKDFGDASLQSLANQFDLLVIDHPHMGAAHASGCLHPYNNFLSEQTLDAMRGQSAGSSLESYNYANRQWALPIDAACQMAAYRPDLLPADSIPKTWEDAFILSKEIKNKGQQMGMALCPTDSVCSFLTLCAQAGDAPEEGRDKLVEDKTILHVLDQLMKLKELCHPECLNCNPIQLFDNMAQSNSCIAYAPLAFGYTNYSRNNYAEKKLNFTTIPGTKGALLGGAGIAVSAFSDYPEAAATYAQWLYRASYQSSDYTINSGQPGHMRAWTNSEADTIVGGFFSGTWPTLKTAYMRPRHPNWPKYQEYLGNRVHQFLKQNEEPSAVQIDLQKEYLIHKLNSTQ